MHDATVAPGHTLGTAGNPGIYEPTTTVCPAEPRMQQARDGPGHAVYCTDLAADDDGGDGAGGREVIRDLHAGVARADDEHGLPLHALRRPVLGGVHHLAGERLEPGHLGNELLGVLPGRHHQEPRRVPLDDDLARAAGGGGGGLHLPPRGAGVVARAPDLAAEAGADAEARRVPVQVRRVLVAVEVRRRRVWVRRVRERAVLLGQVEVEPVVGALPPQRAHAVVALQDQGAHAAQGQARRHRQPRLPRADDDHVLLRHRRRRSHCRRAAAKGGVVCT